MDNLTRCSWLNNSKLYIDYHDNEWGVPVKEDSKQYEFLVLETFQAGLSWSTVLNKRENFRKAFDNFDYHKISKYNETKFNELINDASIIRNKLKIKATITNAQIFIDIQKEFGSFTNYIWGFSNGKQVVNSWKNISEIPAKTALSDEISIDMKKRRFKFVGSTVIYAHLQATGIVNDHTIDCFRYKQVII